MKSNHKLPINITTEYRTSDIITGATVNFTVEDARAMYKLTDTPKLPPNDDRVSMSEEAFESLMTVRNLVRSIAKTILFTNGKATEKDDLLHKFMTNEYNGLKKKAKQVGKIDLPIRDIREDA